MKRLFIFLFVFFPVIGANAGKIVTDSLYSKVLNADVKFNVYLPTGFEKSDKSFPVIYLLHGLGGKYSSWAEKGSVKAIADELMISGESVKAVIVMPNAGGPVKKDIWNGYFNMPGWNYEDFFFQEFMPAVEKKYRVISDKGHRAIMGLSMGGGGSTVYCQRHPDMFSSCYAMSAWLDNDDSGPVKVKESKKDKKYYVAKSVQEHSALAFIDQADDETLASLRTVKWFFDCGDDDFVLEYSFRLYMKMKAAKVKSELRVRNGGHTWEYWHNAFRQALPFASRNFDK